MNIKTKMYVTLYLPMHSGYIETKYKICPNDKQC